MLGRIGAKFWGQNFRTFKILLNDTMPDHSIDEVSFRLQWTTKEEIFKNTDSINLHIPLTQKPKIDY